jgi:CHAT domain-containing protein
MLPTFGPAASTVRIEVRHLALPQSLPDGPELLEAPVRDLDDGVSLGDMSEPLTYVLAIEVVNIGRATEYVQDIRVANLAGTAASGANDGGPPQRLRRKGVVKWGFRPAHAAFDLGEGFIAEAKLASGHSAQTGPHTLDERLLRFIAMHNADWRGSAGEAHPVAGRARNPPRRRRFDRRSAEKALRRFDRTGSPDDLRAAIDALERQIAGMPDDDPRLAVHHFELARSRETSYVRFGAADGLDLAIESYSCALEAIRVGPPEPGALLYPVCMDHFGCALAMRHERDGDLADLEAAIDALELAGNALDDDGPEAIAKRKNLGNALVSLYEAQGDDAALDRALELLRNVVDQTPARAPQRGGRLYALGRALFRDHERTGDVSILYDTIDVLQEAADEPGSQEIALRLNGLGGALMMRFERLGHPSDLDAAIAALDQAVAATPAGTHALVGHANNLGGALVKRYQQGHDLQDLHAGIRALERAIESASAPMASPLSNLGVALVDRFKQLEQPGDLERAVDALQAAVDAGPPGSPQLARTLHNLGVALRLRYELQGHGSDLQAGIAAFRRAGEEGLRSNLQAALNAGDDWGSWAAERDAWREAVEGYRFALRAMEGLYEPQLGRVEREVWLATRSSLPRSAAIAHAKCEDLRTAVMTLDRGRALMLSEALMRDGADLDQLDEYGLRERYEKVAARLRELDRSELEFDRGRIAQPSRIHELRTARADLQDVIAEIRSVPGLEGFLGPPSFELLAEAAPMVYLLAAKREGLALIVEDGHVTTAWLHGLAEEELHRRTRSYFTAYVLSRCSSEASAADRWLEELDELTHWLWTVAMSPVLDATPGQFTLIPVGALGLLPLHAAWTEDASQVCGRRYALDDALITYAPNARALQSCRRRARRTRADSLLAVADSVSLGYTQAELDAATRRFEHSTTLAGVGVTVNMVVRALSHDVLHFACHGSADAGDPLAGALHLAPGQDLDARTILGERLGDARLAILSACDTGLPGDSLPEEVVGLPTSFIQAGASGVIASQWQVGDLAAMALMTRFYELWRDDGIPPAEALRMAQRWIRDVPNRELTRWHPALNALADEQLPAEKRAAWDEDHEFMRPDHWAAFTYTGA